MTHIQTPVKRLQDQNNDLVGNDSMEIDTNTGSTNIRKRQKLTDYQKRQQATSVNAELPSSFLEQLHELGTVSVTTANPKLTWSRPKVKPFNPNFDPCIFQQIDVDDYVLEDRESVIRLYGCNSDQNSVVCHVNGFSPYFYIAAPINYKLNLADEFKKALNVAIQLLNPRSSASWNNDDEQFVLFIEHTQKSSIFEYHGPNKALFLKITVRLQNLISTARRALKAGFDVPGLGRFSTENTYESNIPYPLRFMIDTHMQGCSWIELPAGKYTERKTKKKSNSQIEIDVHWKDLIAHQPINEWSHIAPIRILSFDIECSGRKGVFPDASMDAVIQIASMVTVQGESKPFIRNVMTLNSCAHIVGSHTMSFDNEKDLLMQWSAFVQEMDPDVIIGYNIINFDLPYLLDRAETLGLKDFAYLSRNLGLKTVAKDARFSSKAYGTRDSKNINLDGRLQLDLLQLIQRDYKLRSYTLNSVCSHFLGEQKEEVDHSIITDLQNGNPETRRRLAVYCLKDAYLPQRLLDKLMCLINYIEMARVTGVPFSYLLTRGQQIKVISQLYRKVLKEDLLVPARDTDGSDDTQYEGATVIDPIRGFHELPVSTLDFTSLYPSIMQAHNLCYSTYLPSLSSAEQYGLVKDKDYKVTPSGSIFVKPEIRKGILPQILENLLSARRAVKAELKKENDPFKRAILDGRQLALKISANSVYGFTGATIGKLPLLALSSSVTAYGRVMIEKTKTLVQENFNKSHGYEHDAQVIYGDTDSVMVKFGVKTVEEAMELGRKAAAFVTSHFEKPINLDFEKVYYPYLLINKKRYAGLYWTNPNKHDKMDTKGIETVRRDNCRLVPAVITNCLNFILEKRDVNGAIDYTKGIIADLLQNKIDLSLLVISKALGRTEYAAKQAHNELAIRMRKRDAGSAPSIGDRVSYVIIKGAKDSAAYEKAEDPIYVLENSLPIDTKYYLENQLKNPLQRIFEPILGSKVSTLFSGEHTRTVSVSVPTKMVGMMRFAVKKATCLGCKAVLKNDKSVVCDHCKPKLNSLYLNQVAHTSDAEMKFARLWTQCQRCQGSLHQDILCKAQDCPIFYMRTKAKIDADDAAEKLRKFELSW